MAFVFSTQTLVLISINHFHNNFLPLQTIVQHWSYSSPSIVAFLASQSIIFIFAIHCGCCSPLSPSIIFAIIVHHHCCYCHCRPLLILPLPLLSIIVSVHHHCHCCCCPSSPYVIVVSVHCHCPLCLPLLSSPSIHCCPLPLPSFIAVHHHHPSSTSIIVDVTILCCCPSL